MYTITMSDTRTLYVRDQDLWERARKLAGSQGLSSLVERAVRQYLDQQEPIAKTHSHRFVLPVRSDEENEMEESIEFQGHLLVDSAGFSLEQIPRIQVYRTSLGRFVVYRTYPMHSARPSHDVYPDLESLLRDKTVLATTWITEEDKYNDETDLTPELVEALKDAVGRPKRVLIDELKSSQLASQPKRPVRLGTDGERLRLLLGGRLDLDVLLVAMFLLDATERDAKHLSETYAAFAQIKPVSRLGNTAGTLGDLPAAVRGYLNADARECPQHRLFVNTRPGKGFWGLSTLGERRAVDVLNHLGLVRG
jgi:hypothetical protein